MEEKYNQQLEKPITSFRCDQDLKEFIDRKVAEIVYEHSSRGRIYKYTRTDLILEAIKKYYGYQQEKAEVQ
ncbi:MAG: hypothetical protein JSS75_06070 [Bacteroidetes bacterium]|nr:hypothetical protein [Bacteroidota bacterium]